MMYQGTKVGVRGLLSVCLAWALAACQTIDPYTGEQKTSNATKGAAVGAASGAVIGAIAGGDRKGAAIGAGVGLLAGAGVGHYMDQQEAKLRAQLQGTGVSVTRRGDNIILNMPGNVTFATGQADIRSDFYPVLDSVGLVLEEFEKTLVEVVGHTDSTGSDAINQPLSERRAASVGRCGQRYRRRAGFEPPGRDYPGAVDAVSKTPGKWCAERNLRHDLR
jgi:outer membrane protein OmpA-like peptidoglycan-associated protein